MKVSSIKNALLIVLDKNDNLNSLKSEISNENYSKHNIIIDLNNTSVKDFLIFFKTLEDIQKNKNKSLVFLNKNIDNWSEEFNSIPTLQEAIDFIDLEEIERDLNSL